MQISVSESEKCCLKKSFIIHELLLLLHKLTLGGSALSCVVLIWEEMSRTSRTT